MKTGNIILMVVAGLLGLFFGNALGGILWALILGVISVGGAYIATSTQEKADAKAGVSTQSTVEDPKIAQFLFKDTRAAALWLPLRIFIGWEWLDAGMHKFQDPKWMSDGTALLGFWQNAVKVPDTGKAPITYEWWRGFLQGMIDSNAHVWFAKVITFGEMLVGLGLIVGALVGVAAFFGALMNFSFLLSGSSSTNPIMLVGAFLLVLAWKTAGWIGADRVLLPFLGTPWQGGKIVHRQDTMAPTSVTS